MRIKKFIKKIQNITVDAINITATLTVLPMGSLLVYFGLCGLKLFDGTKDIY